ncbi:MAG: hypothetical protein AAF927_06340 [Bacteroidota bacterium]
MKKQYILSLIGCLLLGCTQTQPEEWQDFAFPLVRTLSPINIDENGAEFRAEILRPGNEEVIDYGFVWSTDESLQSVFRQSLGSDFPSDSFSFLMYYGLFPEEEYYVRAYASVSPSQTIYSHPYRFVSKGSKQSPWSKGVIEFPIDQWKFSRAFGNEQHAHLSLKDGKLFEIDIANRQLTPISNRFNPAISSYPGYNLIYKGDTLYTFLHKGRELYQLENDVWNLITERPIVRNNGGGILSLSRGRFVFAHQSYIYELSPFFDYRYDLQTGQWEELRLDPYTSLSMQTGIKVGDDVYLQYPDGIRVYDLDTQNRSLLIEQESLQGKGKLIAAYDGKLFFQTRDEDSRVIRFFLYDIKLAQWQELERYPYLTEYNILEPFRFQAGSNWYSLRGGPQLTFWEFSLDQD